MKNKFIALILLSVLIINSSLLASCAKKENKYSAYSFDYFDTVTSIVGYAKSEAEFNVIANRILFDLEQYHKLFNIYHRYENFENLCTINELVNGEHRIVTADKRIVDMLEYAKEMFSKTNGKVNVAMGSVLSIWHDYREIGLSDPAGAKIPPMDNLLEAAEHTNINDLIIDKSANTIFIADSKMKLDVGAIAKGYSVEMIATSLENDGISGYVINVGGNVRTIGTKQDGEKWVVGIENPNENDDNPYLAYLELAGESLVTSGSYQRYYYVDGKRYHHIIDPATLMPSEDYLSISIVCKSSADGDALSTALFCLGLDEGVQLIESLDEIEAMWVKIDGTIHYSSGFGNYIK